METKKEQLTKILEDLRKIGDMGGASIISRDGLIIASDLSSEIDGETFAAMSAAMMGAAETAVSELKQGSLSQIIADAEKGKLIGIGAGKTAILISLIKKDANLGLILLEMKKASKKITMLLD